MLVLEDEQCGRVDVALGLAAVSRALQARTLGYPTTGNAVDRVFSRAPLSRVCGKFQEIDWESLRWGLSCSLWQSARAIRRHHHVARHRGHPKASIAPKALATTVLPIPLAQHERRGSDGRHASAAAAAETAEATRRAQERRLDFFLPCVAAVAAARRGGGGRGAHAVRPSRTRAARDTHR